MLCKCFLDLLCCRDGETLFCDMPVPAQVIDSFRSRKDNQIMGLEILSIALGVCCAQHRSLQGSFLFCRLVAGISTFANRLQDRNVVIWSDNTGAEAATRTGW